MRSVRRKAAIAVSIVAASSLVAGGVVAATRSSDEAALRAGAPRPPSQGIERKVNDLLGADDARRRSCSRSSCSPTARSPTPTREAGVGGVFSLTDPVKINQLQHIAVEQSRLHIPILFAYDTIHGYRTIFPIPLGAASSFDPDVAPTDAHDRRPRVGRGRHQADLQPDGRRLARAALGPHRRGRAARTRTSAR